MHAAFPFLAVAALVIVVPGQDTALTIRSTLGGGRRAGLSTALGVSCGQALWALATSLGLAALLVASEPVFLALRLVGAAYLIWLGGSSLWRALRASDRHWPSTAVAGRSPGRNAFRVGLASNLGNPKMALFFTSLLPQFVPSRSSFALPLSLGLLFALLTLTWLTLYTLAVDRASGVLRRPIVRRAIDAVTGAVLVCFGVRLFLEDGTRS